jgi:uncharacterized protein YcbK (DUF882 family)
MHRAKKSLGRVASMCVASWLAISSTALGDGALPKRTARVPTYREMVRMWHTPPDESPPLTPEGWPSLVLDIVNTEEHVELAPLGDDGGFTPDDLQRAGHALRDPRSDAECIPDARMLDLAYRIQMHFNAKALRIISGFRTPRRKHSRHGAGSAIDLVVPGTKDAEVARYARSLGFVGVGLYTRSGFVHIDSRAQSYFWVDGSAPGQRSRTMQVYAKAAAAADAQAIERGETPPGQAPPEGDDGEYGISRASITNVGLNTRRR